MAEPLPGNPTTGQLAAADQKHAVICAIVDQLVAAAHAASPGTDGWIRFTYNDVIDVLGAAAGSREAALEAIACSCMIRLLSSVR